MISNKDLDAWLKKHRLSLVLADARCVARLEERHPSLKYLGSGEESYGEGSWSSVFWQDRTVVACRTLLGRPHLIHELAHAVTEQTPRWIEEYDSWMYAAERRIARQWGVLDAWVAAFGWSTVPEFRLPGQPGRDLFKHQKTELFTHLSSNERRARMRGWEKMLKEANILRGQELIFPKWPKQTRESWVPVPRGMHWATPTAWIGFKEGQQIRTGSLAEFRRL